MTRRAFDVAVAIVIGVVSAPAWVSAAVALRMIEGAPVLHRATRVGRGGECFTLYKLRTMTMAPGPAVTAGGDQRVTRLGSFLRRTKLDELPQLWNVVRGDMSMVGPRPEDPQFVARYTEEQRRLLSMAPGITSPAAIAYRNEEAILAAADDPEQAYVDEVLPAKLAVDLAWIDRRSLRDDLRVLTATVRVLLR